MAVTTGKGTQCALVLLIVCLIPLIRILALNLLIRNGDNDLHNSADTIVTTLARIGVAVFQLGRITTVSLRSTCGTVTRVEVAIRINGSSLVAAIAVKVKRRLELEFNLIRTLRKGSEDVSLDLFGDGRCVH